MEEVTRELHSQYVLAYYPQQPSEEDKVVKIVVRGEHAAYT